MGAVIFIGILVIVVFLCLKLGKGGKVQRGNDFNNLMIDTIKKSTPITGDFSVVMAQSSKDGSKERITTGYEAAPGFVIGYNSREMYIVCVGPNPTATRLAPDPDFILHFTSENLDKITFGAGGRISFKPKDTEAVFVVTVTDFAVSMMQQPENRKDFTAYIKEFAARNHLE